MQSKIEPGQVGPRDEDAERIKLVGRYTGWGPDDVLELRPEWTPDRARNFLAQYGGELLERVAPLENILETFVDEKEKEFLGKSPDSESDTIELPDKVGR